MGDPRPSQPPEEMVVLLPDEVTPPSHLACCRCGAACGGNLSDEERGFYSPTAIVCGHCVAEFKRVTGLRRTDDVNGDELKLWLDSGRP